MPKQANLLQTKTLGPRRTSWHPSQLQVLLGLSSTVKAGLVRRVHGNVQHSCGWNLQAPWKVDVPTFGFELLGRVWMDPNTTTNIAATCLRINQKLQLVVCKETPAEGKSTELASKWLTSTTKIATSACTAPCTMLGTKSRWPGASKMVNCLDRLS